MIPTTLTAYHFALIFLMPGLLAILIGICNELSYNCRKRDNTRRKNSSSQTYRQSKKQKIKAHYDLSYRLTNKGYDTSSLSVAKDCYERLQVSYREIQPHVSGVSRDCFEDDIALIRDNIESIMEEKWDKKASGYLSALEELYYLIYDCDFKTVDVAYKSKKKFLDTYQKYWDWTRKCADQLEPQSATNLWNKAKEDMKFYLSTFDSISLSGYEFNRFSAREQLDRQLTSRIESIRPEYQRKIQLYDLLVDYVAVNPDIARCKLLKVPFDGFTEKEVAACYRSLIAKQRLIEVKIGNRYFVSLTDKELSKRSNRRPVSRPSNRSSSPSVSAPNSPLSTKEDSQALPESSKLRQLVAAYPTVQSFIAELQKVDVRYVDNRDLGGYIWVEGNPDTDAVMPHITVRGAPMRHTLYCDCLGDKPAWFISER